mmetsp:Transcript_24726/g.98164  ORF Transcript_24726/g.98164 Transcript_24726/m.98164 type:complete len:306 (+) Transcript_24726:901-1818(+)
MPTRVDVRRRPEGLRPHDGRLLKVGGQSGQEQAQRVSAGGFVERGRQEASQEKALGRRLHAARRRLRRRRRRRHVAPARAEPRPGRRPRRGRADLLRIRLIVIGGRAASAEMHHRVVRRCVDGSLGGDLPEVVRGPAHARHPDGPRRHRGVLRRVGRAVAVSATVCRAARRRDAARGRSLGVVSDVDPEDQGRRRGGRGATKSGRGARRRPGVILFFFGETASNREWSRPRRGRTSETDSQRVLRQVRDVSLSDVRAASCPRVVRRLRRRVARRDRRRDRGGEADALRPRDPRRPRLLGRRGPRS